MKKNNTIEELWPASARSLGKALLQSLDETIYKQLVKLIFNRALKISGSHKHARELVQKINRRRYPYRHVYRQPELLAAKFRNSVILDSLYPGRENAWVDTKKRTKSTKINLAKFSLLDSPIETFGNLIAISKAEACCRSVQINFEDQEMLDISPYLIWGLMREKMAPCIVGGSIFDGVRAAIDAAELRHFLRIGGYGRQSANRPIMAFKLRRRRSSGTSTSQNIACQPSTKEKVSDDLTDSIDSWLKHANRTLTDFGRNRLYQLSGELLDNAERHARQEGDGEWSVAGLMDRRVVRDNDAIKSIFVCNFAFVNFGLSIADTILNAEDESVRMDVDKYCEIHRGSHSKNRSNLLATVFALQDGVSRVSQKEREKGGVGMMTAVEAVVGLSETAEDGTLTAVSVISGSSCVKLTHPFLRPVENDALRFQWLNNEQSPEVPPADQYAFSLPVSFPGTIITCRFVLSDVTQEVQHLNA